MNTIAGERKSKRKNQKKKNGKVKLEVKVLLPIEWLRWEMKTIAGKSKSESENQKEIKRKSEIRSKSAPAHWLIEMEEEDHWRWK